MHRELRLGVRKWRTFREWGKKQPSRSGFLRDRHYDLSNIPVVGESRVPNSRRDVELTEPRELQPPRRECEQHDIRLHYADVRPEPTTTVALRNASQFLSIRGGVLTSTLRISAFLCDFAVIFAYHIFTAETQRDAEKISKASHYQYSCALTVSRKNAYIMQPARWRLFSHAR